MSQNEMTKYVGLLKPNLLTKSVVFMTVGLFVSKTTAGPVVDKIKLHSRSTLIMENSNDRSGIKTIQFKSDVGSDTQTDLDGDNIPDLRIFRSSNYEVELSEPRGFLYRRLRIRKDEKLRYIEAVFYANLTTKTYKLTSVKAFNYKIMRSEVLKGTLPSEPLPNNYNYGLQGPVGKQNCQAQIGGGNSGSDWHDLASRILSNSFISDPAALKLIDSSCGKYKNDIVASLGAIAYSDSGKSKKFFGCVDEMGDLKARGQLIMSKLWGDFAGSSKPLIVCDSNMDDSVFAQYSNGDKQIHINKNSLSLGGGQEIITENLFHELLHVEISDESVVQNLVKCCSSDYDSAQLFCLSRDQLPEGDTSLRQGIGSFLALVATHNSTAASNLKKSFKEAVIKDEQQLLHCRGDCSGLMKSAKSDLEKTMSENCSQYANVATCRLLLSQLDASFQSKDINSIKDCLHSSKSNVGCLITSFHRDESAPYTTDPNAVKADMAQSRAVAKANPDSPAVVQFKALDPRNPADTQAAAAQSASIVQQVAGTAKKTMDEIPSALVSTANASEEAVPPVYHTSGQNTYSMPVPTAGGAGGAGRGAGSDIGDPAGAGVRLSDGSTANASIPFSGGDPSVSITPPGGGRAGSGLASGGGTGAGSFASGGGGSSLPIGASRVIDQSGGATPVDPGTVRDGSGRVTSVVGNGIGGGAADPAPSGGFQNRGGTDGAGGSVGPSGGSGPGPIASGGAAARKGKRGGRFPAGIGPATKQAAPGDPYREVVTAEQAKGSLAGAPCPRKVVRNPYFNQKLVPLGVQVIDGPQKFGAPSGRGTKIWNMSIFMVGKSCTDI